LRNRGFAEVLSHREIAARVFDEAHCLSNRGHDFRPDYWYAARFIREFAQEHGQAVACFTAPAKHEVSLEICAHFQQTLGQTLIVFDGGVARDNLQFYVESTGSAEKFSRIHTLLSACAEGVAL
jgi:ATP-dependent DNA helicase RecQ